MIKLLLAACVLTWPAWAAALILHQAEIAQGIPLSAFLALSILYFFSERGVLSALPAPQKASEGMQETIQSALSGISSPPRIRIITDRFPACGVAKSPLSRGTIWLTHGLVDLTTEEELRELIRSSAREGIGSKAHYLTFSSWMVFLIMKLAVHGAQPWKTVSFSVFYSVARIWSRLEPVARPSRIFEKEKLKPLAEKAGLLSGPGLNGLNPAFFQLFLFPASSHHDGFHFAWD